MKGISKKTKRGKRGPLKEDGGRPKNKLYDDADRWIVIVALWCKLDPKEQRSFWLLQVLDSILTPHKTIELAFDELPLEKRLRNGIEHRSLTFVNVAPDLALAENSPARRPLSAPSGMTLRTSRLKNLQAKIARYQLSRLNKTEECFRGLCFLALNMTKHGEVHKASMILDKVGFDLPEAARKRFYEITRAI